MKLIEDGKRQGHWVMLQNCHLFKSWMPVLAAKVNELQELRESPDMDQPLHPDFKLILTSMPVDYFPTSVLQTGLKFTTEPPRGIKNNLQRLRPVIDALRG
jgi:dynein heavy chain